MSANLPDDWPPCGGGRPHESVEEAMRGMRPGTLLGLTGALRKGGGVCPRCRENKQAADRYRRERDHLAQVCARYERRARWREAFLFCHAVAYALAAWAVTQIWPDIASRWAH